MSQTDQITPYQIRLSVIDSLVAGDTVSIDVTKYAGTEELRGYDFLIGYEDDYLNLLEITPGPMYDIPGDYEWEYLDLPPGPYPGCLTGCPSGLIQILSMADISNGTHKPLTDPSTGRIKVPANGTVLFSMLFEIDPFIPTAITQVPVNLIWNNCSASGVAYTYRDQSEFNVIQGNSDMVFNYTGVAYQEVSQPNWGLPTPFGTPERCLPLCGDVNSDEIVNILDILYFIEYKFLEGPEPESFVSTDVNGDGEIDILDIIYFIDYKFNGGPDLNCPITNVRFVNFYNGGFFK